MAETIAIIDYGSGNLKSAEKAFQRAADEAKITADIIVTSNVDQVKNADRIVLPGVGAFGDCRAGIMAIDGMDQVLRERVIKDGAPFFGICVGMQLMAERGLEKGIHDGFGWIRGQVVPIVPDDLALKVPHMGWNNLKFSQNHPIFAGLRDGPAGQNAYFVHSYQFEVENEKDLLATTDHGGSISAVVGRNNMVGTQFHPEKSQAFGLKLIGNFLRWKP
ncbi:Imidazole glycerol phosphate synthase amidotransferase subunit [hydrothermal vent metagenome]|uniref:Imidazole glycerol phosphate synthase amidotransferase subunit n=1 Tax=hydrothermal vent metagenome TaxID=652676 RepID=A0A3B0UT07_9ZZZZ